MGIFDKMKSVFGQGDYDDEYDEDDDFETGMPERKEREPLDYAPSPSRNTLSSSSSFRRNDSRADSKVVNINTNVQMQVRIINPVKYEDAQEICDEVKARKPVVVNLEKMEYPTAQRIMDFLSGTCYSLDGTIQRVASNIYIIAPENVDVSGDFKEELKTKGVILPWMGQSK